MGQPPRLGSAFAGVLTAAQAGGGWAFERLWHQLSGPVAGYLRAQGAVEPDDLTSEVFLGVFQKISSFEGNEEQFRSWVFTIAHRRLQDERRRRARRPEPDALDDMLPGADDPEDDVLASLSVDRVRAVCERLVPDQRDVLLLRLVAGLTVEEVAAALGKQPGAVKALQRRGFAAIQRIFDRQGVPL